MKTLDIIKEIQKLPVQKRMLIIEKTIQGLRENEKTREMKNAANALYKDYTEDSDLVAFTVLDCENFYETR